MSFPAFLLPYFLGVSPPGLLAFAAKAAVYCLFQRPLGTARSVALAVVVHAISWVLGIVLGLLLLPRQGFGWKASGVVFLLSGTAANVVIELACLLPVRRRLSLKGVGVTVVAANVVYGLGLAIVLAACFGVASLSRVE
jgi:hypothetical protein